MDFLKDAIDFLSDPKWSFTISLIAFGLMLWSRALWTKRGGLIALAVGVVFLLLSMLDEDFFSVVAKPDNVPITIMVLSVMLCIWFAFRRAALNDSRTAAGGLGAFSGGIMPVRSLRTIFSHASGCPSTFAGSRPSSERPPLFTRVLWHERQYCLRNAAFGGGGAAVLAP